MTFDHGWNERAHTDDSVICVVPKPFQNGDYEFCSRARVAQGRKNFGVKKPRYAVANLKIDPADGLAVAKSGDALVRNLNVHASFLIDSGGRHRRLWHTHQPLPDNLEEMFRSLALFATVSVLLTGCVASSPAASDIPAPTQQSSTVTPAPPPTAVVAVFDTTLHSIDEADSLWVVVDKLRRLTPKKYAPKGLVTMDVPHTYTPILRRDAAKAYKKMFRAARKDGIDLVVQSGYRSYAAQVSVYNGWVASLGRDAADLQSARPGYSEHQIGLSVDISAANRACTIQACFGRTPEGKWLMRNAPRFGWHLRYPKGKTAITGYIYEPWHWRYVGVELATELSLTPKITLEEFFGLPAAPDYAN